MVFSFPVWWCPCALQGFLHFWAVKLWLRIFLFLYMFIILVSNYFQRAARDFEVWVLGGNVVILILTAITQNQFDMVAAAAGLHPQERRRLSSERRGIGGQRKRVVVKREGKGTIGNMTLPLKWSVKILSVHSNLTFNMRVPTVAIKIKALIISFSYIYKYMIPYW